jgi:hypothetical protein
MNDDGVEFRNALYASIHDKVSAHMELAKQNMARNLIIPAEEEDVPQDEPSEEEETE